MNIEGMGPSVIDSLLAYRLVQDAADFYTLKKEDIEQIERMGEKSAQNIVNAVADSRGRGLAKLLFGLGIRFLGAKGAELIANRFETMDRLCEATADEIMEVDGIGQVIAGSLFDYLHKEENLTVLEKLKAAGVPWKPEKRKLRESCSSEKWSCLREN